MEKTALIAGVSGLVGNNLAQHLCSHGWKVFGLSRNGKHLPEEVNPVTADMLNLSQLKEALVGIEPSHIFFASWLRQKTEKQNIEVNSSMIRNLLDAVCPSGSVEHVALVTGLKHYLGPFEQYAKGTPPTPFKESQPRLDTENFYYAQEDALFEASRHYGFTWSVHRPHTLVGYAIGNAMNIGMTLAVFGAICRETGQPFHFPGSATQWNGLTDMTDARQLASHVEWAALTPAAHNQALNVINGDIFRWKWMWERLAAWFDIAAVPFSGEIFPLEQQLAECASIWTDMAAKHDLKIDDINQLVSCWHTDADLGRGIECVTDMTRSRLLGFDPYRSTEASFYDLFERLRQERIIP